MPNSQRSSSEKSSQKNSRAEEPIQLDGESLGVLSFEWQGDRYRHQWSFKNSASRILSNESDSQEVWPISPPLQQIHRQSFGDGREVIFGVGMAGRGHWSASFTLVPDLQCWIVELACRCPSKPAQLCSSYQLSANGDPAIGDNDVICVDYEAKIFLEPIAPSTEAVVGSGSVEFKPQELEELSEAHQWAFRLRVKP